MEKVFDKSGHFVCMGDASTGLIEYRYRDSEIKVIIPVGQRAEIRRGNRTTIVSRTPDGFLAESSLAA